MKLSDSVLNRYKNHTDEELIVMLRDGEKPIMYYILEKYKNLVRSKANAMFILGADEEDLIQEGMTGLFKAIRDYDYGRDASFYTFADLCVTRQIYTAVTASGRKKHMPLNSYISLYSDEDDEDNRPLEETISGESDGNPESQLIDRESVELIEHWIDTELSSFERQTLELYMTGMSYVEIAKILGKDDKSTDNALQRAKQKIRKLLEDNKI